MPYIGPDGRVTERRSPWRWSIISDFFQGVYDFLALFVVAMVNPPQLQAGVSQHCKLFHLERTIVTMPCTFQSHNHPSFSFLHLILDLYFCHDLIAIRRAKQITHSVIKDVPIAVPALLVVVVVVVAHHWAAVVTFEAFKTYKGRLVHLPEVGEVPNAIEDESPFNS